VQNFNGQLITGRCEALHAAMEAGCNQTAADATVVA
jgi:hypothetical protein